MATVVEGAIWSLSDEAAEVLVRKKILKRCSGEYHDVRPELGEVDPLIYHFHPKKPAHIGYSTMNRVIKDAEREASRLIS